MNQQDKYEDMLYLNRPISSRTRKLTMLERAAQFAPFAALTGHNEAIIETARTTENKIELSEEEKQRIADKLNFLSSRLKENIEIKITYFIPDSKKSGGSYATHTGIIKKIDDLQHLLILKDTTIIPINHILSIESELFYEF